MKITVEFYGDKGSGKTTLANQLASAIDAQMLEVSTSESRQQYLAEPGIKMFLEFSNGDCDRWSLYGLPADIVKLTLTALGFAAKVQDDVITIHLRRTIDCP